MYRLEKAAGSRFPWRKWAVAVLLLLAAVLARRVLWQVMIQLLCGMVTALAALPLMKLLESKCSPGMAALLSITGLSVLLLAAVVLVAPAFIEQARQLLSVLPSVTGKLTGWIRQGENWLVQNGLPIAQGLRRQLAERGEELLGNAAPAVIGWAQQLVSGLSKWMLAPVIGYYFLRDRKRIGEWLQLLLPVQYRGLSVRLLREIRRLASGYLRGQLMISLAVGGLTAAGLLLCGIPAWLLLGALMGILELIPYVGPLIGGAVVALFSLQAGPGRMLWSLAVVLVVQQLEGSWLSPRLVSDATKLHPVAVLLCMMAGGLIGGITGILLAVPSVLCIRAGIQVFGQAMGDVQSREPPTVKER